MLDSNQVKKKKKKGNVARIKKKPVGGLIIYNPPDSLSLPSDARAFSMNARGCADVYVCNSQDRLMDRTNGQACVVTPEAEACRKRLRTRISRATFGT